MRNRRTLQVPSPRDYIFFYLDFRSFTSDRPRSIRLTLRISGRWADSAWLESPLELGIVALRPGVSADTGPPESVLIRIRSSLLLLRSWMRPNQRFDWPNLGDGLNPFVDLALIYCILEESVVPNPSRVPAYVLARSARSPKSKDRPGHSSKMTLGSC
jgi:hypothetical protein